MSVTFVTPSVVNLFALTTLGVNVKETSNPIGHFGTGFKYAVAMALEAGAAVTITTKTPEEENVHTFGTHTERIRDQLFKIVTLDNKPLGFTTNLGKNWKPWMAVRELISNTSDENGFHSFNAPVTNWEFYTTIKISNWADFEKEYENRRKFILNSSPIETIAPELEIHKGENTAIFYRGIKALELDKPTLFTYNLIRPLELTEDRTIKNAWMVGSTLSRAVTKIKDIKTLTALMTASKEYIEHDVTLTSSLGVQAKTVIEELYNGPKHSRIAPNWLTLYKSEYKNDLRKGRSPTKQEQTQLTQAKETLRNIGLEFWANLTIEICDDLGPGVMGSAVDRTIYIASATFYQGQRRLIGTLAEEYLHTRNNYNDCEREFQNYLIDRLAEYAEYKTQQES
jgi:hypothetical protein